MENIGWLIAILVVALAVLGLLILLARMRRLTDKNRELGSQLSLRMRELDELNAISAIAGRPLQLDQTLADALRSVLQIVDVEAGGIYLSEEGTTRLRLAAHQGLSDSLIRDIDDLQVGEGFSGRVVESGQSIVVNDVSQDPRLTRLSVREEQLHSLAVVPIGANGTPLGTLFAITRGTRQFSAWDVQLLTATGRQIAWLVQSSLLFATVQRRAEQFRLNAEVGRVLSSILSVDQLLPRMASLIREAFGVYLVEIGLVEGDNLVFRAGAGGEWGEDFREFSVRIGEQGISGWVAQHGEPLLVPDVGREPRYLQVTDIRTRSELTIPLKTQDTVIGVLNLESDRLNAFDESDMSLLQGLANQAAVTIQNARFFEAERRRADQFRLISEVGRQISSILEIDELLMQMAGLIREALGFTHVGVGLVEGNEVVSRAEVGAWQTAFHGARRKVGEEGLWGWVAETGEALMVADVQREPRHRPAPGSETLRSHLTVPLKVKGRVIGVLTAASDRVGAFDESDRIVLQLLANQAAVAIENARYLAAYRHRAEQFRVLAEIGRRTTLTANLDEMLLQIVKMLHEAFGYYHVGIGLIEGDEVVYHAGAGELWDDPTFAFRPARLKVGSQGLTGHVAATGKPLLVGDVDRDPRYVWLQGSQTRSEALAPILIKGQVVGVIDLQSERLEAFDETDLSVLESLANQIAAAMENARLYEQSQQTAVLEERQRIARELHDAVTQTLFSASLIAQALPAVWQRNHDEGLALLGELRQLSRGALAEMRTLLLELRPASVAEAQLSDLLRQLAEAAAGREGIPVEVNVEGSGMLPGDAHVAFYRIAQESLNNIVKHARASAATVTLRHLASGGAELRISDDGRGFSPAEVQAGELGLGIMHERAASIGARLSVDSAPGKGTRVTVKWEPA